MGDTIHSRPLPRRPDTGLLAWQATIGYISAEHSPDAMLTVRATAAEDGAVAWSAAATWGGAGESVDGRHSCAAALRDLWIVIEQGYRLLHSVEAMVKRPVNYADDQWLDPETQATLDRLVDLTLAAFETDWQLIIVYQPVIAPVTRVQTRLLAHDTQISGRGPTLRDACRDLYTNAAPGFFTGSGE